MCQSAQETLCLSEMETENQLMKVASALCHLPYEAAYVQPYKKKKKNESHLLLLALMKVIYIFI